MTLALVSCALLFSGCATDLAPMPVPTASTSTPKNTPQPEPSASSGPAAAVTIASVDVDGLNVTVGGFVTEASEDGGACHFTATKDTDGTEVVADTMGIANVRSTSCGITQIAIDSFSKGTWSVVLSYTSADLALESEPLTMEIP